MSLSPETIRVLSATPPPQIIFSARTAHSRIQKLEAALGIPHSAMICHVRDFTARVQVLEEMLATKAVTPASLVASSAPLTSAPATTGDDIIAAHNAIKDPSDRMTFYRENKRRIDRAYRDTPRTKVAPEPSGSRLIDELNSIENGAKRTTFYRANKAAIDTHFRTNHEHH